MGAIRKALDEGADLPIMAYAASILRPFTDHFVMAESAPQFGDRKTYQMDGANRLESLREVALDIEGRYCYRKTGSSILILGKSKYFKYPPQLIM